jgi:hypothetical protein
LSPRRPLVDGCFQLKDPPSSKHVKSFMVVVCFL